MCNAIVLLYKIFTGNQNILAVPVAGIFYVLSLWLFKLFLPFLQVVYALLMPASATLGEDASDFQYNFLKSGGLPLVLSMLTRNNFLPSADMETRRGAYLNALKIAKLLLTAVGFGHVKAVAEACQPNAEGNIPVSPVRPHA